MSVVALRHFHVLLTSASCFLKLSTISCRLPSVFPVLEPEYVGKELVDGMLRNKSLIVLPKSLAVNQLLEA